MLWYGYNLEISLSLKIFLDENLKALRTQKKSLFFNFDSDVSISDREVIRLLAKGKWKFSSA